MENRVVGNVPAHKKMLNYAERRRFNDEYLSPQKLRRFLDYIVIPDLVTVLSDVERTTAWFCNYGPNRVPLVAEYEWWLIHVAKVNNVYYLIYPDWTHSHPIKGKIYSIVVNDWEIIVNINGHEYTIEKDKK